MNVFDEIAKENYMSNLISTIQSLINNARHEDAKASKMEFLYAAKWQVKEERAYEVFNAR